ncbi:hypothetical protein MKEN_01398100 [Mycena kentingensis (nom. inval.)]|nr:hypothetical protein MKEN_01398100 [Mycena kentingensis (nom. inval.)]
MQNAPSSAPLSSGLTTGRLFSRSKRPSSVYPRLCSRRIRASSAICSRCLSLPTSHVLRDPRLSSSPEIRAKTGRSCSAPCGRKTASLIKKPTVKQVAAILRLSKKYDIAAFRQRCLQLLKYDFPITFPKYSMAYKSLFSAKIAYAGPLPVSVALVEVINLAREAGLYSILPAAFYRFLNFTRLGEFSNQIMQALSLADQVVCLQGHARMTDTYARTPLSWLDGIPCEDCTDDGDCYAARNEMIRELGTDNTSILHHFFENWDEVWDDHFCKHCVVNAKQEHHHQVQYYWKLLPGYFNLPPWEELVKMDFE